MKIFIIVYGIGDVYKWNVNYDIEDNKDVRLIFMYKFLNGK